VIRQSHQALLRRWHRRFAALPPEARAALIGALSDLRREMLHRAQHLWSRHKPTSAYYAKVVAIYAGHLVRALRASTPAHRLTRTASTASDTRNTL